MYLIIDNTTSHIIKNIFGTFKNENREVSFIFQGFTRLFQYLDVAINKPFKQALKEKCIDYCIKKGIDNKKISRIKMIDFIINVMI